MRSSDEPTERCELCGRHVPLRLISLHHLVPREKGGKPEHRVPLCSPCHKQVHATFGNKELEALYADLPALRATPELQTFIRWIRRQPPSVNVTTRRSNSHPRSSRRR